MYYEHFGLTQAPYKITPNTDFFFTGGNRGPVLEALIYAITRGEGIVKVTGEVGSGKTMLCNMLQSRLPDNVESVYLANPSVGPEEVLHAIAFELSLGLDRKADRLEVMHVLQDYLVTQHAAGQRIVIFIEESQSMPLATLEEIRLLSNLETRNDKLLQIVLFGQPELDENLRRQEIRQLRDRVAHSFRLQPLTDDEVRQYLTFRMRAAGYRGPEIFSGRVVKRIARASSGLTRRINLIADKALLAAFSENTHTILPQHVRAALRDSEFGHAREPWRFSPAWGWGALTLLTGAALGVGFYTFIDYRVSQQPRATSSVQSATKWVAPAPAAATQTRRIEGASAVAPKEVAAVPDEPAASPTAVASSSADLSSIAGASFAAHRPSDIIVTPTVAPKAAPVVAPAEPAALNATDAAVAKRLEATEEWARTGNGGYSIQLLVAEEQQLRNHLKALPKFIEINDIYLYRGMARGRPTFNLLWGSFEDRTAAQEWLAELPAALRTNRPYIRSLAAIRAELDRQARYGP